MLQVPKSISLETWVAFGSLNLKPEHIKVTLVHQEKKKFVIKTWPQTRGLLNIKMVLLLIITNGLDIPSTDVNMTNFWKQEALMS